MKMIGVAIGCALALSACDEDFKAREARYAQDAAEIKKNGFAVVGHTPDGHPLLMTRIDTYGDRVYFAGDTITAHEDCGKGCTKSITTNPSMAQ